jgi:hypothetical protein
MEHRWIPSGEGSPVTSESTKAAGLKQRAKNELLEYLGISFYICVFLGALLNYRRVVLAEVGITYTHYGYAVVQALILGKIVLIGDALHLGEGRGDRPLIVSALYRSLIFGVYVLVFHLLERVVHALIKGESLTLGLAEELAHPAIIAAHVSLVILAFIPFFMLREAGRQLGEERFQKLLFRRQGKPTSADAARVQREGGARE